MTDFFRDECQKHIGHNCQQRIDDVKFGICDNETRPHAYVDTIESSIWIVPVDNSKQQEIIFIPVDKSLNIRKADGNLDSTCDAILSYENNIVFIELKEKDPPWIAKAIDQLKNTISIFALNHDIGRYKKRRAFASNKNAAGYAYNMQEEMDKFRNETQVRLIIAADRIVI
jgi:hypothetical protein